MKIKVKVKTKNRNLFSLLFLSCLVFFIVGCADQSKGILESRSSFCQASDGKKSCIIVAPKYFSELKNIAAKHDLILLDIDYVVMKPENYKCEITFLHKIYTEYESGSWPQLTDKHILNNFYSCAEKKNYAPVPVSRDLVEGFSSLSNKKVLGLTSRGMKEAKDTLDCTTAINMRFFDTKGVIIHPLIKDGIIFAGNDSVAFSTCNKGKILQDLIDQGHFGKVRSVFFIDDCLENLQNVEKALAKDIIFTGIHLTQGKTQDKALNDFTKDELDSLVKAQINSFIK